MIISSGVMTWSEVAVESELITWLGATLTRGNWSVKWGLGGTILCLAV